MKSDVQSEILSGMLEVVPLALGVAIYGLAFGLLASQAEFNWIDVGLMGALVFGGSSQIVAVERLAAGAGITAAIVAGIALNLRLLLITASVRELFAGRPLWQRMLGAHLSSDESWALTLSNRSKGKPAGYWFLVGAGSILLVTWVLASCLGVYFASYIPDPKAYAFDFAFTAAFIAIARSLWRNRTDALPWLAAIAAVLISSRVEAIDDSWSVVIGGLTGALIASLRRNV